MVSLPYNTATESIAVTATSGGASSNVLYTCPNNFDAVVTFLHISNGAASTDTVSSQWYHAKDNAYYTIVNNKSKPRIPFGSLVELGILKPGTVLFDPKKKFNAKIMVDGSIKCQESEGSIHKVAAKIMGAESFNGWTYWHCDINGSAVVIDSLRQKFISERQI